MSTKPNTQAAAYATSRVGERGERSMPNEYEWDALAAAHEAGQCAAWIPKAERMPPYGERVFALHRGNDGVIREYTHTAGGPEQEERMVAWMPIPAYPKYK